MRQLDICIGGDPRQKTPLLPLRPLPTSPARQRRGRADTRRLQRSRTPTAGADEQHQLLRQRLESPHRGGLPADTRRTFTVTREILWGSETKQGQEAHPSPALMRARCNHCRAPRRAAAVQCAPAANASFTPSSCSGRSAPGRWRAASCGTGVAQSLWITPSPARLPVQRGSNSVAVSHSGAAPESSPRLRDRHRTALESAVRVARAVCRRVAGPCVR